MTWKFRSRSENYTLIDKIENLRLKIWGINGREGGCKCEHSYILSPGYLNELNEIRSEKHL